MPAIDTLFCDRSLLPKEDNRITRVVYVARKGDFATAGVCELNYNAALFQPETIIRGFKLRAEQDGYEILELERL